MKNLSFCGKIGLHESLKQGKQVIRTFVTVMAHYILHISAVLKTE